MSHTSLAAKVQKALEKHMAKGKSTTAAAAGNTGNTADDEYFEIKQNLPAEKLGMIHDYSKNHPKMKEIEIYNILKRADFNKNLAEAHFGLLENKQQDDDDESEWISVKPKKNKKEETHDEEVETGRRQQYRDDRGGKYRRNNDNRDEEFQSGRRGRPNWRGRNYGDGNERRGNYQPESQWDEEPRQQQQNERYQKKDRSYVPKERDQQPQYVVKDSTSSNQQQTQQQTDAHPAKEADKTHRGAAAKDGHKETAAKDHKEQAASVHKEQAQHTTKDTHAHQNQKTDAAHPATKTEQPAAATQHKETHKETAAHKESAAEKKEAASHGQKAGQDATHTTKDTKHEAPEQKKTQDQQTTSYGHKGERESYNATKRGKEVTYIVKEKTPVAADAPKEAEKPAQKIEEPAQKEKASPKKEETRPAQQPVREEPKTTAPAKVEESKPAATTAKKEEPVAAKKEEDDQSQSQGGKRQQQRDLRQRGGKDQKQVIYVERKADAQETPKNEQKPAKEETAHAEAPKPAPKETQAQPVQQAQPAVTANGGSKSEPASLQKSESEPAHPGHAALPQFGLPTGQPGARVEYIPIPIYVYPDGSMSTFPPNLISQVGLQEMAKLLPREAMGHIRWGGPANQQDQGANLSHSVHQTHQPADADPKNPPKASPHMAPPGSFPFPMQAPAPQLQAPMQFGGFPVQYPHDPAAYGMWGGYNPQQMYQGHSGERAQGQPVGSYQYPGMNFNQQLPGQQQMKKFPENKNPPYYK